MIIKHSTIDDFKSTQTQKTITLDGIPYVLNNEQYNIVDSHFQYNFSGYSIVDDNGLKVYVNSLYPAASIAFKSNLYSNSINERANNSRDHVNTYFDDHTELCGVVQINNFLYSLSKRSSQARKKLDDDLNVILLKNNGKTTADSSEIAVVKYDTTKLLENNQSNISGICYGLEFNKLIEINGNIENDYNSGVIYAQTYKCKNQYNTEYSTPCKSNESYSHILDECRDYIGIDKAGQDIFLKYYDNAHYVGNLVESYSTISCYQLSVGTSLAQNYNSTMQRVETIKSISRKQNANIQHKSNMYSLQITVPLLAELDNDISSEAQYKNIIKLEIENYTRTLTPQIMPAQTQLFKVNIIES